MRPRSPRRPRPNQPLPGQRLCELREHLAKHVNFAPEQSRSAVVPVSLSQQLIQITCTVGDEGDVRVAQLRGVPVLQVTVAGHPGARSAARLHLRPRRHAGRHHRPHPADLRLQSEQPHLDRGRPRRAGSLQAAVPSDIMVCIDEAYVEYIRDGLVPDSLGLARKHSNVVVLRTFSKATVWPGCGSATRSPIRRIVAWARCTCRSNATTVSQAAAIASLSAEDEAVRPHQRHRRRTHPGDRALRQLATRAAAAGELRLAAAGRSDRRLRPAVGQRTGVRAAVRRAMACG